MEWVTYVLLSATERETYVGITNDLERRVTQHNGELPGGARTTTRGRPWSVGAVFGPYPDRSKAQSVEAQVKRLRGKERLEWLDDEE